VFYVCRGMLILKDGFSNAFREWSQTWNRLKQSLLVTSPMVIHERFRHGQKL
jgi:hypothetical protein